MIALKPHIAKSLIDGKPVTAKQQIVTRNGAFLGFVTASGCFYLHRSFGPAADELICREVVESSGSVTSYKTLPAPPSAVMRSAAEDLF